MQIRVVLISVAAAALVLGAAVLGFIAERARSKSFVGYDGRYCVYRTTAALGCGIGAAVLLLAGLSVLSAASGCFGRRTRTRSISGRTRSIVARTSAIYLTVTLAATALFLFGAWRNAGGERAPTRGRFQSVYGCSVFKGGLFLSASVASLVALLFGIAAYVYQETAEPEDQPPQAVAMGQPQQPYFQPQQQAYYQYPAMGYPIAAPPPPPPYGGYGAKAPAGTS
ncbi:uncharacterized protein LOC106866440 [Brachypodium distachyon]|uniref:Uncharacterized protein n=1 Tax=Brachypodium distachyon TaxID=15368 RepID=A0A0Q3QEK8_BRADI|nr:uncharacterized protein LOC106866440 [Brachypodium distachyon]KQK00266.1 hypothetical protein BRADI_3g48301v3 [Brachypodium distachyon]|eukprot:XP_014756132.1 uncharacterized protein LOC106866440 [Brachypodium distachyon]